MELRHLRHFVAVAEERSFRRAAERLHIAQPPLSLQIKQLQAELGVTLLERSKPHVALTDAVSAFLGEARQILAHAGKAPDIARRASRGETGQLSIGFMPSPDLNVLPTIYPVFRQRAPDVRVTLQSMNAVQQVAALKEGRIDVGFLRQPMREDGVVIRSILREPLIVVMPDGHRLASHRRVALGALANEPYISFPRHLAPGFFDEIVGFCRRAGFSPNVVFETDHLQTNLGFVAMGLGVSLLPASAECLKREGVACRPLRAPVPHVELAVAYRPGESHSALRVFIDVVDEVARRRFNWNRPPRRSSIALR